MSFPDISCPRRTDDTFRSRADELHHKARSVIEELNIDMIMDFPTSDPLHLLELGIMKKCLLRWAFGEKGYTRKWSRAHVDLVSRELLKCAKQMPREFHRKPRTLNYLRQWKGVEFRTMLLYTGMVVLRKALDDDLYQHFISICCAVRICSSNKYKAYQELAGKTFTKYVQNYAVLYGEHRIGSNVHNLCHIVEDMRHNNIGNLMDISTYKFENCLRLLGLQLKHGNLPLEQISRRIIESLEIKSGAHSQLPKEEQPFIAKVFYESKFSRENQKIYNEIEIFPNIRLSNRRFGDSWFLSDCNDIIKMKCVIQAGNDFKILGQKIHHKKPFFETPIESSKFHIYQSNVELSNELYGFSTHSVVEKMLCLPHDNESVFIPLL